MDNEIKTRYTPQERQDIAQEILNQFAGGRGGNHFATMTGAHKFVALDGGITFRLKPCDFNQSGINTVTVELTPADEYTVTFLKVRGTNSQIIAKHEGIYFDELPGLFFNATNLLPYMGF